jgi:hypothetical protein
MVLAAAVRQDRPMATTVTVGEPRGLRMPSAISMRWQRMLATHKLLIKNVAALRVRLSDRTESKDACARDIRKSSDEIESEATTQVDNGVLVLPVVRDQTRHSFLVNSPLLFGVLGDRGWRHES